MSLQNDDYKLLVQNVFRLSSREMQKYQKKKLMSWQRVLYLVAKLKKAFILTGLDEDS